MIRFPSSISIWLIIVSVIALTAIISPFSRLSFVEAQTRPDLGWGSTGEDVRLVQSKLSQWGYLTGNVDGVFGADTYRAVVLFQQRNGLWPDDGVVRASTWEALGFYVGDTTSEAGGQPAASMGRVDRSDDIELLARVVAAEAEGEPFEGQVAVAAVILNRVNDPGFPNSLSGVIYQPHAFESITNGLVWRRTPSEEAYAAARSALNGWDPTYGSLFFWNPSKPVTPWIWSRNIIARIGSHVFAL